MPVPGVAQPSLDAPLSGGGFTPGPWVVIETGFGDISYLVCEDVPGKLRPICAIEYGHPAALENATLLAAAPDLLAACQAMVAAEDELLSELRAEGRLPDLTEKPWTLVDDMRAAIAQALGLSEPQDAKQVPTEPGDEAEKDDRS